MSATDTAESTAAPLWQTALIDSFGLALAVWSIPAAVLLVGTPIVMAVALLLGFTRWIVLP